MLSPPQGLATAQGPEANQVPKLITAGGRSVFVGFLTIETKVCRIVLTKSLYFAFLVFGNWGRGGAGEKKWMGESELRANCLGPTGSGFRGAIRKGVLPTKDV